MENRNQEGNWLMQVFSVIKTGHVSAELKYTMESHFRTRINVTNSLAGHAIKL